jgi:hypothetical protein
MSPVLEFIGGPPAYGYALVGLLIGGVCSLLLLLFISAPYGRHARPGWGPMASPRTAWLAMEIPALLAFLYGTIRWSGPDIWAWAIGGLFIQHYAFRSLIYPFIIRTGAKGVPWLLVGIATVFNSINGGCNSYALMQLRGEVGTLPLVGGIVLFAVGALIHHHSDHVLRNLRRPGETGYFIPHGGAYQWVSCPNYLGELLQWTGFALAAGTSAAWVFVFFTFCNLAPRARTHHSWYRETFPDYPQGRKAMIPGLL